MARLKSFLWGLSLQSVVWAVMLIHIFEPMPGALNVLRFYGVFLLLVAVLQLFLVLVGHPVKPAASYPENWLFRLSGWLFLGMCIWNGLWLLVVASVSVRCATGLNRVAFEREVANG